MLVTNQSFNLIRWNHLRLHTKAIFIFAVIDLDVTGPHDEHVHIILQKGKRLSDALFFATNGRSGILHRSNTRLMMNNQMSKAARLKITTRIL